MIANKLSILEETETLKNGCCIPVLQDTETKKISFNNLKKQLSAVKKFTVSVTANVPTYIDVKDCNFIQVSYFYDGKYFDITSLLLLDILQQKSLNKTIDGEQTQIKIVHTDNTVELSSSVVDVILLITTL